MSARRNLQLFIVNYSLVGLISALWVNSELHDLSLLTCQAYTVDAVLTHTAKCRRRVQCIHPQHWIIASKPHHPHAVHCAVSPRVCFIFQKKKKKKCDCCCISSIQRNSDAWFYQKKKSPVKFRTQCSIKKEKKRPNSHRVFTASFWFLLFWPSDHNSWLGLTGLHWYS